MSKSIPAALLSHLGGHSATVATCWRIQRVGNFAPQGFTDCSFSLTIDGVEYVADTGYTRSAIAGNSSLAVDNMDLEGLLSDVGVTDADLRGGLYDFAEVEVFLVNYLVPSDGQATLRTGVLGNLTLNRGIYSSEVRGLAQLLSRVFIEVVTPDCAALLYDSRCKVVSTTFTNTATVDAIVTPRRKFEVTLSGTARTAGYFDNGLLNWDTGNNTDFFMEVKFHPSASPHTFELFLPMHADIEIGDTLTIKRGCDKSFNTCLVDFTNVANFRGFNKVPGPDHLIKVPDGRN